MDLPSAPRHWAERTAHKTAVVSAHGHLTYAQLFASAKDLARELATLPGRRVGIRTTDPVTFAVGFYAAVLAGKPLAVLDPAWPQQLLHTTATRLEATTVICSPADDQLPEGLIPSPSKAVDVFTANPETPEHISGAPVDSNQELLAICTSGSTGEPKAVVRTRASWEASLMAGSQILGATSEAVTLCPGPISHGLGLYAMVESIHSGGTFVAPGRWDLPTALDLLAHWRCTRIVSVPTIIQRITDADPSALSAVNCVISGGEALSSALVNRLHTTTEQLSCVEYYGSSEHSLIAYRQHPPENTPGHTFVGAPFPGVKLHVHAAEPGEAGALFVDSPFNAEGYDPSGAAVISRCGAATSVGDTAQIMPDGRLKILGRSGGMLNVHGNNVHPGEIADAFDTLGLPGVQVLAHLGPAGTKLIAYTDRAPQEPAALRQQLREVLAGYKIPHELVVLERWPVTSSGKIASNQLPDPQDPSVLKISLK